MVLGALEHLLIEQGFSKVPSNLPEFSFFFHQESTYVNILHIIDYKQGLYITEDQYVHIKEKIRDFFQEKGISEVHILSLIVSADTQKAKSLFENDSFCWVIHPVENRLLIYENHVDDFYGMRKVLEDFLYEISLSPSAGNASSLDASRQGHAGYAAKLSDNLKNYRVNILLVVLNVIIFMICTFTGELLYNKGDFSVLNLIEGGEWHRIFSSMFLHADIEHLVSNMLVLYYIGNVIEKQMGHTPYLILYFLSGLAGNIFSAGYELLTEYYVPSVGASGAIFGVEGALLMFALLQKGKLAGISTNRIVFSIAFSLYCGFTSSYVNNAAHIGGVLMGFLTAGICWLFMPDVKKEGSKREGRYEN